MRALPLILTGAALLLLTQRSRAASVFVDPASTSDDGFVTDNASAFWDYYLTPEIEIPSFEIMPADDSSLRAFLYMIRRAEHSASTPDADTYRTFYGGARFFNLADHPVNTGEMRGVRLSDQMCRNAGFGPGCVSTAAGAYQLIRPTWDRVRRAGSWGPRLPDFSPESQDEAARRLLIERGALTLIESGDIESAIIRAGREWASLPGSTARQNPRDMETALSFFNQGLFA